MTAQLQFVNKFHQSAPGFQVIAAEWEGYRVYPQKAGPKPEAGEVWEVEILPPLKYNQKFRVARLCHKTLMAPITFSYYEDERPLLLLFQSGRLEVFTGADIEGYCKVVSRKRYTRQGRNCVDVTLWLEPHARHLIIWPNEKGHYWTQKSWAEVIDFLNKDIFPQEVRLPQVKEVLTQRWPTVAEKFERHERETEEAQARAERKAQKEAEVEAERLAFAQEVADKVSSNSKKRSRQPKDTGGAKRTAKKTE